MSSTDSKVEKNNARRLTNLYRHATRAEWGHAILAWDRGSKRAYQFEDGKLRVFKQGYYGLLVEVESPIEEKTTIIGALRRRLGWKEQLTQKKPKRPVESIPFESQLQLFREFYPKGFNGSKWAREKRGIDTTRQLQRHREMTLVRARKQLCLSRLTKLIEEEKYSEIVETVLEIGRSTDLVTNSKLHILEDLGDTATKLLAIQIFELLHGEEQFAIRFERYADTLARVTKKQPSWQLATLLPALFFPKERVCVKTTTQRAQAACLGRHLSISTTPNSPKYAELCSMASEVRRRIEEAGLHPRDLVDIYDFMETTLSPKARKLLDERHADSAADRSSQAA